MNSMNFLSQPIQQSQLSKHSKKKKWLKRIWSLKEPIFNYNTVFW
jgi:hypothetical protein